MSSMGEVMGFSARGDVDFTNLRYHLVRLTGANQINVASEAANGDPATVIGVAQTNAVSGRAIKVGYHGESKVVASRLRSCHGRSRCPDTGDRECTSASRSLRCSRAP